MAQLGGRRRQNWPAVLWSMGSIFTSLLNSSGALAAYGQALNVVTNNVTNANTPGYVRQTASLQALPFDISVGLPGGVQFGSVESSRNAYAERNVRDQQSSLGYSQQKTTDLSALSSLFDVTGKTGIAPAIDGLFQSFSQLSINPNDPNARQGVITQASQVAKAFQSANSTLQNAASRVTDETRANVDEVNRLADTIAQINAKNPKDFKGNTDAGVDAQLNSTLEELSKYVNYSAIQQPDGSVTLYVGGQTPLVIGDEANPIQGDFSTPQIKILDGQGHDVTSQIKQGQLAATLEVKNSNIASYQTDLDTLAKGLADQVNTTLSNGIDANGAFPTRNLFTYTAGAASETLAVDPALTPDQIAAALPGAAGGSGNALNLSALANTKPIGGYSFTGFFGKLGGTVGQDISDAQSAQDTQTQVLSQAENFRSQISGVNLDQEAETLVQFQRAYQATSKLFGVLDQLTQTALNLIP
jgi:flagellar hook-associated protein 1 FlgK